MAINTYATLTASVSDWLHRTDLSAVVPTFVSLAEERIYHGSEDPQMPSPALRLTAMETQVSGNTSAGIGTLTDLLELRRITMGSGSAARDLDYVSRHEMTRLQRTPGQPTAYTFDAGSIVVGPIPDGDYEYVITYYKRFPALSATQATNWLLSNAPAVYLYGALVESAPYLHDDARSLTWYRMFVAAIKSLQSADDALRTAGGSLRIRAR